METLFTNKRFIKICTAFIAILCVCAVVVLFKIVSNDDLGANIPPNTISFSGHGEVQAVPDIATIYFTVEASKGTQGEASDEVNTKTKKILDFIKSSGVAERDIKTEGYNSYPKYSNPEVCPMYYGQGIMPPCRVGESKIIGYTVSQSITVKVRKVDDASKVIDGINKIGVTNMSGPNLTIDNEDTLKAEARQKAIDDAKAKAKELASQLGVHLEKISNFSEGGNYPIMYGKAEAMSADSVAPVPSQIPKGENTISSDVTITYEIR